MKIKQILFVLVGVVAVSIVAVAAVLTQGSGIILRNDFVRAGFADPTDIQFKINGVSQEFVVRGQSEEEVINVSNARETVMQQVVIAPGGFTGWHSHPGPVIVLVKSGQLSFYADDCTLRTYSAGQAFVDKGQGSVHIGRNQGNVNLELWSAYLDVPPGGAFRIDVPSPGCGF